jgi:hypothetical protein
MTFAQGFCAGVLASLSVATVIVETAPSRQEPPPRTCAMDIKDDLGHSHEVHGKCRFIEEIAE